jgi:hypothetical protein
MSNTVYDPAAKLRAALKTAGFSARQVTVRQRNSTLDVTIRTTAASLTKVQAIAGAFESVRRDEASGEILQGGNTFVRVEYADALVDPVKASILATLEAAPLGDTVSLPGGFAAVKPLPAHGHTYQGDVYMRGPGFDGCNDRAFGVVWAAERLAIAYLNATAAASGAGA